MHNPHFEVRDPDNFFGDCTDNMEVSEKDYLQIFKLTTDGTTQHVTHIQEQPLYERTFTFQTDEPIAPLCLHDILKKQKYIGVCVYNK